MNLDKSSSVNVVQCCGHINGKRLAKRVEWIPFLLNLLPYSEIIG